MARRTGVTVSFADITYFRPGVITVTDPATGAPVDYTKINTYSLSTATSIPSDTVDVQRTAYANLAREFSGRFPLTLKGGVDVRRSLRDLRADNIPYNFVGADGRASLTPIGNDDSASVVFDEIFSRRTPGFGFPQVQWVNNAALADLYKLQPLYDEVSAIKHLTADDPPIFQIYTEPNAPLTPNARIGQGMHHPIFGLKLKAAMDRLKIECVYFHTIENQANSNTEMVKFFRKQFGLP